MKKNWLLALGLLAAMFYGVSATAFSGPPFWPTPTFDLQKGCVAQTTSEEQCVECVNEKVLWGVIGANEGSWGRFHCYQMFKQD